MEARLSGSLDPVQHEHGDRWDISQEDDGWTAVRRGETPTAQHVIAARTLAELAAKLDAEGDAG